MAKKQCGYCVYMDVTECRDGKFKCEKERTFKFASSSEADDCRRYCERFRKDMYLGEDAVEVSSQWIKNHKPYKALGFYLSTAIFNILGQEESQDLETLKEFRFNLQMNEKYRDMLIKYDTVAPLLARTLESLPNREAVAIDLYNIYIKGTLRYIEKEDYDNAVALYNEMTERLCAEYLTSYIIPENVRNNYDMENSGKGTIVLK